MKFPVFKAFGATLAYLAGHAAVLVKALWLPALLMVAAVTAVMPGYLDPAIKILGLGANPDPNELLLVAGPMMGSIGLLMLVAAILYPMMIVGALRHIVRGDAQKLPFYLGFGGDELRALGAYVLIVVMLLLAYLVFALAIGVTTGVLTLVSPIVGAVGALVGVIAGLGAFAWFATRISLTFPASMATKTLGLAQSFRATKGNSARLFVFWFFIWLILVVIALVYFGLFMSDAIPVYQELVDAGADPVAQQEANLKLLQMQRDLYDMGNPKFWPFATGTFVYTVAMMALVNAAAGIAWRYLTDRGAPDAAAQKAALAA